MPSRSHCIPRLIAFYFKSSNAKLIPLHALSLPFITGILCNWPPTLLVTKCVEEWVLNAPIHKAITKHARIIWLDKKQWWQLKLQFDFENAYFVQSNDTDACFAVAFRTQASNCFITSNIPFLYCHIFILSHLLNTIFISLHVLSLLFMKCHL